MLNFDNSNESLFELQARLEELKGEFDNYETNQRELEMLNMDNLSELQGERKHYSSLYFKVVGQIHYILQNTSKDDSECVKSEVKSHKANVTNLPSINLPTFSGNYQEWLSFHDLFSCMIHENESLSDIQKFHYLKLSLSGEAAKTILSLETSSIKYNIAWNLIKDRFQNKRVIVFNLLDDLFNINKLTIESAIGLRNLNDEAMKNIRALNALGL